MTEVLILIYELTMGHWKFEKHRSLLDFKTVVKKEVKKLNKAGFCQRDLALKSSSELIPRYVRVNTLQKSLDDVIILLEQHDWTVKRLKKGITEQNYKRLVSKLEAPKIYVDAHIDNLLIFPRELDLHEWDLVKQGTLILQDKASCFSAQVLRPEPESFVIDACAAPGMKTTHLAAIMQNKGSIWAFDRNKERLQLMKEFLKKTNAKIVRATCNDFLKIDISKFQEVEYALVDPPCTGSGMVKRGEYMDESESPDNDRIQSLANLQAMILKHALRLPSLRRLVYSTCSIHWLENEGVVLEVLADTAIREKFELIDPLPNWNHRGKIGHAMKGIGHEELLNKCLRASSAKNLTNGFFVALFQRK